MRAVALTLVLATATRAWAADCTGASQSQEPTAALGVGAAGALLAGLVSFKFSVNPSQSRAGENADCVRDDDCTAGHFCAPQRNQCVRREDGTPQRAQATEVWLQGRAVALREELALGRGLVIAGLAKVWAMPAPELGRVLKRHRAALLAAIGDGSDPKWAARFIARAEALVEIS